jgi:hypothetical protein
VLPLVLYEGDFFPFKFWLSNRIRDGMYYRNELYYRLHTVESKKRSRLYHYACKLSLTEIVIVTANSETYSLWISLRSPKAIALNHQAPLIPTIHTQSSEETHPDQG